MSHKHPLSVAFLWHMHQPFYKDLVTGEYILPWVRLHAIKDYYDMACYVERYPKIRAVFNIVPSLFVQIEDYINGSAKDKFLEVTKKAPEDLSHEERIFILKNFFLANWETMIRPYSRYADLLSKRGRFVSHDNLLDVSKRFSSQELLDLQVWFNLTWFGQIYKENDSVIKGLMEKGKNFNHEDKKNLIDKQMEIMGLIIPKYKKMQESGQIEISVTPFYHPILPLLYNNSAAKISSPYINLPKNNFAYPEDAAYQINSAVQYYSEKFGISPNGMWPSEGSVSIDIIPLIKDSGIKWIATDEEILSNTLGHRLSAQELFKPYIVEKDGKELAVIFRDKRISDDVGFVYSKWNPNDAADDIILKLHRISENLPLYHKKYLVSIILDGENAWEYYQNNGQDFFDALYGKLSNSSNIETVRVNDFIEHNRPPEKLSHLFPGSWINHNFNIWIGHSEDNTAWDYLFKARDTLSKNPQFIKEAWQELYIAEGSDWNWWYGDDHSSENDEEFDMLFRKHLMNIYHLIGMDHPKILESPIKRMKIVKPMREPVYLIEPKLDGEVTNYYEWLSAGLYSVEQARGAMHQSDVIVKNIYYGFSMENFFIRIDPSVMMNCGPNGTTLGISFEIDILKPCNYKIELRCTEDCEKIVEVSKFGEYGVCEKIKQIETYGANKIIEIGVKFSDLEIVSGAEVAFLVSVKKDGKNIETWPKGGMIIFNAPEEDFEAKSWFV